MIFSITIILLLTIYFIFLVYKTIWENKLLVQREINKKLAAQHYKFNIIKKDVLFTDQNSTLVFSELIEPEPITSPSKIAVNNLYQSNTTSNFFWYRYIVVNSEVVEEQILLEEKDTVKQFLLEMDKAIYLKIFGQPSHY